MAQDPTIGRIVVYRARTGFVVPAVIAATRETLYGPGVQLFRDSNGTRGVPPLSSPEHVHLVVFSPGLPQPFIRTCAECGGPIGVGQGSAEVEKPGDGEPQPSLPPMRHTNPEDCLAAGILPPDLNAGGTFREWDVPYGDPHPPQSLAAAAVPGQRPSRVIEHEPGSWRWPERR